jgi:hypothetical protein
VLLVFELGGVLGDAQEQLGGEVIFPEVDVGERERLALDAPLGEVADALGEFERLLIPASCARGFAKVVRDGAEVLGRGDDARRSSRASGTAQGLPELILCGLKVAAGDRDAAAVPVQAAAQVGVAEVAHQLLQIVEEPVGEVELLLADEDVDEVEQHLQPAVPVAELALQLEAAGELLAGGGVLALEHVLDPQVLQRGALEVGVAQRLAELAHPLVLGARLSARGALRESEPAQVADPSLPPVVDRLRRDDALDLPDQLQGEPRQADVVCALRDPPEFFERTGRVTVMNALPGLRDEVSDRDHGAVLPGADLHPGEVVLGRAAGACGGEGLPPLEHPRAPRPERQSAKRAGHARLQLAGGREVDGGVPFAADALDQAFEVGVTRDAGLEHHEDRDACVLGGLQLATGDRGDLVLEDQHEPI